ncbi:nuclear transport factor 2 family protein [Pseudoxanthomonas sp. 10H]|uniref:nuclear transport factor 2 family protein n=1 Tax=Pseudoxanthomonas sp. 10H TaxID=3242729 RepID=UPI0035567F6A
MKRRYQQRAGGRVPGGIGAAAGALLAALCSLAGALPASARDAGPPPGAADLAATIAALDAAVFDAFNRCAEPGQLEAHAAYFDPAVEFYHDTGGVTWTREAMLENTRRHACGRFTRALVPGSLAVHPVPGFGAIARGGHRFCQADTGRCDGEADFVMLWRHRDGAWQVTRVLSYGHRPAANR